MSNNSKTSKQTLEDYIFDMETRPPDMDISPDEGDLWSQLKKKEADLVLAAELGKALLDKNNELTKQQERIIEEYNTKIEILEQEKYILRRKLSEAESEGDVRVSELQGDFKDLQQKMEHQDQAIRLAEREKNSLIEELSSQNTRLTAQIRAAHQTEAHLTAQLQQLKDQYMLRNSNLQDHVNSLESLKDELRIVSANKDGLESRLNTSLREKDSMSAALEEASDRIHTLERHVKEQETKLQNTIKNLDRMQRENSTLSERLESGPINSSHGHRSLLHEMECDDGGVEERFGDSNFLHNEARSVFKQLKVLYNTLKTGHDDDSGLHSDLSFGSLDVTTASQQSDMGTNELRQGMLSALADDLIRLIMSLDAVHFKTMMDQTRLTVVDQEDEMRRKQDLVMELQGKMSVYEVELQSAIEERDQARNDASQSHVAQDEVVAQARQDRDNAVARRTKAEIELAKTRVDLMQANGQLLEAVQQKYDLAQQLDQWQVDMQELIEEQMKSKLNDSRPKLTNAMYQPVPKKPNRLLRLFQRQL